MYFISKAIKDKNIRIKIKTVTCPDRYIKLWKIPNSSLAHTDIKNILIKNRITQYRTAIL